MRISKEIQRILGGCEVESSIGCLKDVFLRNNFSLKTTPQFSNVFVINLKLVQTSNSILT